MTENLHELFNKVSTGAIPPVITFAYSEFHCTDILDDQGLTLFTLRAGLLVQGVTKLAFQTPSLDQKTVSYLRSPPIWAAAVQ
jgi:hypothetical protein